MLDFAMATVTWTLADLLTWTAAWTLAGMTVGFVIVRSTRRELRDEFRKMSQEWLRDFKRTEGDGGSHEKNRS